MATNEEAEYLWRLAESAEYAVQIFDEDTNRWRYHWFNEFNEIEFYTREEAIKRANQHRTFFSYRVVRVCRYSNEETTEPIVYAIECVLNKIKE